MCTLYLFFLIPENVCLREIVKNGCLICLCQPRKLCLPILIAMEHIIFEGSMVHYCRATGPTSSRMLGETEHQLHCVSLFWLNSPHPDLNDLRAEALTIFPGKARHTHSDRSYKYLKTSWDVRIFGKKKKNTEVFVWSSTSTLQKKLKRLFADFESQKPNLAHVLKHLRHASKLISF